ncbi:glycosyl transferase family protein [uncultured Rhodoblastus sp.]|uniref:glycosyl transferase family protein n=1 Tax=uncultured Rhodoblastus sp. TaxID=543037 RepID=UPI0025D115E2|nr:glycosyl transferase family protein [uncultured Rhodoblastus sp.]
MHDFTDAINSYVGAIAILFTITGIVVIIYSLDDVFVDICFWVIKLTGRHKRAHPQLSEEELLTAPQHYLAVLVPAWLEAEVIFRMLDVNVIHAQKTIFFVGAYPNDPATQDEVRRAAAKYPDRVQLVIGERSGPTTKADCLNTIINAVDLFETQNDIEFAGYILHDSEDVMHPLESNLFNFLISEIDFIQIPVYSFSRGLQEFVAGVYMDEFAEFHKKDLVVREQLTGIIPCAGVAACFSRRAIKALQQAREGEVFDATALTEDYDVAFHIKKLALRAAFIANKAPYTIDVLNGSGALQRVERRIAIATRENFPSTYEAAYRQRARWILGIAFQATSKLGWGRTLSEKIFFLRDRKGILSGIVAIVAYFLTMNAVLIAFMASRSENWRIASYALLSPKLQLVFFINVMLVINRLVHRIIFTTDVYGLFQGLMAGPRIIVSNFVNFSAGLRALYIFIWRHKVLKEPLSWDKTAHTIPMPGRSDL